MKEKLKYQDAEYEIVTFDDTDVLTTSVTEEGNDGGNIDGDAWH
jgi:hypothetical protein